MFLWVFLFTIIFSFISFQQLYAQDEKNEKRDEGTVKELRKTYKSKSTLEKIVSLPGDIIYLPFMLITETTKNAIIFTNETKITARVYDYLNSDDGRRSLLPTYESRTGAGVQLVQRGLLNPESKLSFAATIGAHQRQRYELNFQRIRFFNNSVQSDFRVGYQLLSAEAFFGIGPNTDQSGRTEYSHEKGNAHASFGYRFSDKTGLNVSLDYDVNNIFDGKDDIEYAIYKYYQPGSLPGLGTKIKLFSTQLQLAHDTRNNPGNPTSGGEYLISGGFFQQVRDSQFGFWKFSADMSRYMNLFYSRVLVFRIASEITEPFKDRDVPFFYLSELGQWSTIRGFKRGRYRDQDYLLGSLEYRYPLTRMLNGMLFVDAGQVSHNIFNSSDDIQVTFGGGVRIWNSRGLIASIQLGKSKDGYRLYFSLN